MKTEHRINLDLDDVLVAGSSGYQRVQDQKNKLIHKKPHICMERAAIVTRVYRENEEKNIFQKRAMAFDAVLKEMSIFILKKELFVGHIASRQRSAPVFPEFSVQWIMDEIEQFETRPQDKFIFPKELRQQFSQEIYPYWKRRTLEDTVMSYITEDIRLLRFDSSVFTLGIHESGGLGHVLLDYEKILKYGLSGIKKQIQDELNKLEYTDPKTIQKRSFYESCLSICDSVIHFANRYADLAQAMAAQESNAKRKAELHEIALNCRRVPEYSAGTFAEALQSFWFTQIVPQIYDNGVSVSPGRFDQYMYPYYENDLIEGRISKDQAQEMLESLWVKFTEPIKLYKKADAEFFAGYPMGQNVIIGGIDKQGRDVTNDLSYRCLEAHRHMLLMQPNFSARIHESTPPEFFYKIVQAIGCGNGMPQLVYDGVFIPALLRLGVSLPDARDYALVGCVEATPLNTWGRYNGGYINLVKILELALTNGVCLTSGMQVSVQTGNAANFKCFEDVLLAYKKQVEYCTQRLVTWNNYIDMVHEHFMPTPFTSILIDDCIKRGKDVTAGGARYNWTGPSGIGIANVGDAMYAVKKAVFADGIVTLPELVDAMKTDFNGHEELRLYLRNKVAKYGNDDEEADNTTKLAVDIFLDELEKYDCYRHGPFVASLLPVSSYVAFGLHTGASPDGRHAKKPIADGISPQNGSDRMGPTAAAKSVATIDHTRCANGVIFNQRFSPSILQGINNQKKMISFIKAYNSLGGGQIQFNIISSDTLIHAQKHPEESKGLVVRVAGYSAFFHELSKEIQDSIIERTENQL